MAFGPLVYRYRYGMGMETAVEILVAAYVYHVVVRNTHNTY